MGPIAFRASALPSEVGQRLGARLSAAHDGEPFAAADCRATVRRVVDLASELGLAAAVYRGGVDCGAFEADHVWVSLEGRVLDVALPLHDRRFVGALARFVAGELDARALDRAAGRCGLEQRVLGTFPGTVRYIGRPVWSERQFATTG